MADLLFGLGIICSVSGMYLLLSALWKAASRPPGDDECQPCSPSRRYEGRHE